MSPFHYFFGRCVSPPLSSASSKSQESSLMALLPAWWVQPQGCLGNKGQRGARRQSSCWCQQGIPKLLNCGEKQTPQGWRSVCCSWAHTRAGMIMAPCLVIPLPHTSLICKCSEGWPNMLRENINNEKKTILNDLPAPEKLRSYVFHLDIFRCLKGHYCLGIIN